MRAAKVSTSSTTLHLPKDGLCEHEQCFKLTGRAPRHLRFDGFNPRRFEHHHVQTWVAAQPLHLFHDFMASQPPNTAASCGKQVRPGKQVRQVTKIHALPKYSKVMEPTGSSTQNIPERNPGFNEIPGWPNLGSQRKTDVRHMGPWTKQNCCHG